jgi:hypothetical protein
MPAIILLYFNGAYIQSVRRWMRAGMYAVELRRSFRLPLDNSDVLSTSLRISPCNQHRSNSPLG